MLSRISRRALSARSTARSTSAILPTSSRAYSTEHDLPSMPSLYSLTDEEEMLRDAVRKFAQEVVGPKVYEMDEAEQMDPAIIKGLFDQGLMGVETDPDHGGAGASFTSAILVIEELAKVDPSVSVLCDVHNTLVNTLFRKYASKALQDKYLPQLATDKLGSFALSEPGSGSDAFALATKATKSEDGSYYTLDGQKCWITSSAEAEIFLIFANLDPSRGYKGISCFVAEKSMGVEVMKKEKKLGIKASSTCTLNLDGVRIPAENLLGEEGQGYKYAIEILNEGRIGIAGQMVGLAQGAFDKAVPYTLQRKQFGQAVGSFQAMQTDFARIATEIEAARLLTYNAARLKEEGHNFTKQAAMAKYYSSVVAQKAAGSAIEWCGGLGFTRETGIEKFWRDSKIGAIYEGTTNIQLLTIGKSLTKQYSYLIFTRGDFVNAAWSTGRWSILFCVISAVWNTFLLTVLFSPYEWPVTAQNFNFSSVIFGAVSIFAVISWWIVPESTWLSRRSLNAMVESSEPDRKEV